MFAKLTLFFVAVYQKGLRPLLPPVCRFEPSCSEFTRQAIIKYGLIKGLAKGLKRLSVCHPFSRHFGDYPLE